MQFTLIKIEIYWVNKITFQSKPNILARLKTKRNAVNDRNIGEEEYLGQLSYIYNNEPLIQISQSRQETINYKYAPSILYGIFLKDCLIVY